MKNNALIRYGSDLQQKAIDAILKQAKFIADKYTKE